MSKLIETLYLPHVAETRARGVFGDAGPKIGRVLHPSPASPRANRDWAATAAREMRALGLCGRGARRS